MELTSLEVGVGELGRAEELVEIILLGDRAESMYNLGGVLIEKRCVSVTPSAPAEREDAREWDLLRSWPPWPSG